MFQPAPMKALSALLFAASLLGSAVSARADELRFSSALGAAERSASGLAKLTSDQVAVIDALVRRDTALRSGARPPADEKANRTFSQRITAEERKTSGIAGLAAADVAQLDAFVERQQSATLARVAFAPSPYLAGGSRPVPTEKKSEREIHGFFSLSYGVGSGGYSEKSGAMAVTLEDPTRGYAISVGYSETHVKGGYGVYCDPYYEPLRPGLLDDPLRP